MKSELIYGITPQILEDSIKMQDGELGTLDECSLDFFTLWPAYRADLTSVGITKNQKATIAALPGVFYVKSLAPKPEGSARAIVTVNLIGNAEISSEEDWEERRLREISAFGNVVSIGPIEKVILVRTASETAEDPETDSAVPARRRIPKLDSEGEIVNEIIITPTGSAERWNINDPSITVSDTYFTLERPSTTVIGTAMEPPDAPEVPAYIWDGYTQPKRFNHPSGWVLTDRKITIIIPDKVWQVVDTFTYFQVNIPD